MVARAGVVVMAAAGPGKAACRHAAAAAGRVRGRTYLHAKCMVEAQKSYEGQTDDPEAAGRARDGRSRPAGQWSGLGEPRSTRRAAICAHTVRFSAIHRPPRRCEMPTAHPVEDASRGRRPRNCGVAGWNPVGNHASALESTVRVPECAFALREQRFAPSGPLGAARRMMLDATWAGAPGGLRQQWVRPSSCAIAKPCAQRGCLALRVRSQRATERARGRPLHR